MFLLGAAAEYALAVATCLVMLQCSNPGLSCSSAQLPLRHCLCCRGPLGVLFRFGLGSVASSFLAPPLTLPGLVRNPVLTTATSSPCTVIVSHALVYPALLFDAPSAFAPPFALSHRQLSVSLCFGSCWRPLHKLPSSRSEGGVCRLHWTWWSAPSTCQSLPGWNAIYPPSG